MPSISEILDASDLAGLDPVEVYNQFSGGQQAANWWDIPDYGGAAGQEMPDWAGVGGYGYDDPAGFYTEYQGLDEDLRNSYSLQGQTSLNAYNANQASQNAALDTLDEGANFAMDQYGDWQADPDRASALDWLGGLRDQMSGGYAAWQEDPNRLAILDQLLTQSGQDYNAISDVETSAMQQELAQRAAVNRGAMMSSAGGRGVAGGGAFQRRLGGRLNEATAADLMLRANVMGSNQESRDRNLSQFGQTTAAFNSLDQSYLNSMGQMSGMYGGLVQGNQALDQGMLDSILRASEAKAGLEGSAQYFGSDPFALLGLQDARTAATEEREFRERQFELDREQSDSRERFDWFNTIINFAGTGIPKFLMNGVSNFLGGGNRQ